MQLVAAYVRGQFGRLAIGMPGTQRRDVGVTERGLVPEFTFELTLDRLMLVRNMIDWFFQKKGQAKDKGLVFLPW